MKICPTFQLSVLQEAEYSEKMPLLCQQLEACRKEGYFSGFDGQKLYYEYFQAENSRGAIVVVHGLSEFTRKYYEFAWYMLQQGYDVFLYDQRCHGRSGRLTSVQDIIHVDKFSDYQKDLHRFVRDVVRPSTDTPLYLYGHSMGGAIAAEYLSQHPNIFRRAVLSAPMFLPLTGSMPPFFARIGLSVALPFCNGKSKFWFSNEFDPNCPFEKSQDQSPARFHRHITHRIENPCYQTTPLSMRWVHQSLLLRRKLMRKKALNRIKTPILMLCAEDERVVCKKTQEKFALSCPSCTRMTLADTTHAMLCGTSETIAIFLDEVLSFFAS